MADELDLDDRKDEIDLRSKFRRGADMLDGTAVVGVAGVEAGTFRVREERAFLRGVGERVVLRGYG
jgi:hypothetical protein